MTPTVECYKFYFVAFGEQDTRGKVKERYPQSTCSICQVCLQPLFHNLCHSHRIFPAPCFHVLCHLKVQYTEAGGENWHQY